MASEKKSIINIDLKGLEKPALKLLKSINAGFGFIFDRNFNRIRKKASAKADAKMISAIGEVESQEIVERSMLRVAHQEFRRQQNLEAIAQKALPELPEEVSEETVDEDWMAQFFQQAQDVGNEEMQSLWARILAGEVARPGSFSPRTMRIVKDLKSSDAELFTKVCSMVWDLETYPILILYNLDNEGVFKKLGLNFSNLLHLEFLGFFTMNTTGGISAEYKDEIFLNYFGNSFRFTPSKRKLKHVNDETYKENFGMGHLVLTQTGIELANIAGGIPNFEYRDETLSNIKNQGFDIEDIGEEIIDKIK